jgi:hypothetical protein
MKKAEKWAKKRSILQNGSSKMKKDGNFDVFLQEKCTFSADYLAVSEKSSIFACFFAVRYLSRVRIYRRCVGEKAAVLEKLTSLN